MTETERLRERLLILIRALPSNDVVFKTEVLRIVAMAFAGPDHPLRSDLATTTVTALNERAVPEQSGTSRV